MKKYIFGTIALIALVVILSNLPFTQIDEGERGIVLKFGQAQNKILQTGLHFINPFTTDVDRMDVKVQKEEIPAGAASKDLQAVSSRIAVTYHLDEAKLIDIFKSVRKDYSNRYVSPNIQEAVKAATAKYTAEELITKREAVRDDIRNNFVEKLVGTGIIVDNVSIVDFDFSGQFNAAIEAKVTAEQKAKEAQNKLVQVQAEAQQSIEKAKAEAQSIRLQSEAANNDKFIQLKQLEVQLAFAQKWNGVLPENLYGSAPIPFLQLGGK